MDDTSATADVAWRTVRTGDPSTMESSELDDWFAQLRLVRGTCDAAEIRAVRRRRALADRRAGVAPDARLAGDTGRSGREARATLEREALCSAMPTFHDALAQGAVTAGHVDAAALAVRSLDSEVAEQFAELAPELIERAAHSGVDAFGRECRDLARHLTRVADASADVDELERQRKASTVKRWTDRATGLHHTLLSLDPLRDSLAWQSINAEVATQRRLAQGTDTTWNEIQVEAVVAAICGSGSRADNAAGDGDDPCSGNGGRTRRSSARVPEIGVLIDWATLTADTALAGLCETTDGVALPVSTVRRLCCDAEVYPVVLGGDGEVLDHGRTRRTASHQQRRALAAMHRGCAFPGCTVGFDACRIHHVRWWWEHLGPTDIHNLLPLCERHHHAVHEGGWLLVMTPDRLATWTAPDGSVHHQGTTIDRRGSATGIHPAGQVAKRAPTDWPRLC